MLITVTDAEFEEKVLQSAVPVMVDFWAPWCGPCKMIAPALKEIADEVGDKAIIAKVNTDEDSQWAARFGVMGIPTLIVFNGGKEISRLTGSAPKNILFKALNSLLTTPA